MLKRSPIVYAHRGASRELPENTIEAFRLGLELGAHAIETDAHMTRDGQIVLSHDENVRRTANVDSWIRAATLDEVKRWNVGAAFEAQSSPREARKFEMPTLLEALEAFPGVVFNVDAKQVEPDMTPALLRCVRRASATDRVRIASFSTRNLRRVRALGYEGPTGISAPELIACLTAPAKVARRLLVGADAAQIPPRAYGFTLASRRVVDRLHSLGLRVDIWTVNDAAEARRLFALGVDGVMTDEPRLLTGVCD